MTTKTCTKCGETKNNSEFVSRHKVPIQPCKACQRIYGNADYQKHKQRYKDGATNRSNRNREWLMDFKSTVSCIRCGESHPACLEFHHRDPTKKDKQVSLAPAQGWSLDRIQKEIAKCDVLCANCHRKLHLELRGGKL